MSIERIEAQLLKYTFSNNDILRIMSTCLIKIKNNQCASTHPKQNEFTIVIKEAAVITRLSEDTIRRYIKCGKLRAIKDSKSNSEYKINGNDLLNLLNDRKNNEKKKECQGRKGNEGIQGRKTPLRVKKGT